MNKKRAAANNVIKNLMKVTKKDSVLIIFDDNTVDVAYELYEASLNVTKTALMKIPIGKMHGAEPDKNVADEMKIFSVVIIPTTKSLTHTNARKNACKKGARIATLPEITTDMFERTLNADYKKISNQSVRLQKRVSKSKTIRITTNKGTDIEMKIRKPEVDDGFIYKKSSHGNLPGGEVFFAPIEGSANGVFVVDASMNGKVKNPIKIVVESGFATKISGGVEAKKLKEVLKSQKNPAVYNIAELGIGTNYVAKITGKVLEDEKVLGTAHIALGNNTGFGGKIYAPLHLDGVFKNPTIILDNKKILMKNGKMRI